MHTTSLPGGGPGASSAYSVFVFELCGAPPARGVLHVDAGQRAGGCNTRGFLTLIVDDGRVRAGWLSLVAALPPRGRDPAACQGHSASHPPGRAHPAVSASRYSLSSSGLPAFTTCRSSSHRRAYLGKPYRACCYDHRIVAGQPDDARLTEPLIREVQRMALKFGEHLIRRCLAASNRTEPAVLLGEALHREPAGHGCLFDRLYFGRFRRLAPLQLSH
jgi:hypothetical protein